MSSTLQHARGFLPRLLRDPSVNAKAWYLWYFASLVSVGPFLNVFFQQVGLSRTQVGLIGALRPWISAPASFGWAALADKLALHRVILLGCFFASVGLRMLLLLPRGFAGLMAVMLLAEVASSPVGVMADAAVMQICQKESDYGKYRLWGAIGWGAFSTVAGWLLTNLGIRWGFYMQAVLAVPCFFHGARLYTVRRAAPEYQNPGGGPEPHPPPNPSPAKGRDGGCGDLGESDPLLPSRAGTLKQYGVAHRNGAVASGEASEEAHAVCTAGAAVALDGGKEHAATHGTSLGELQEGYWHKLWQLARRGEVLLFFLTAIAMGYGFGTIDSFLFLHLGQMGASETLMGLTLTVTCAAEVPAFQLQDRLLDSWGVTAMLDLTQLVYVLRLALYAALPFTGSPLWVLPIEVLHGITFACGWGAGTVNCKLLAPPGLAATLQGAFQGLYFGAGYGLGSLVGGWVGSRLGWQGMFACASATMLGFWLLVLAARRALEAFSFRRPCRTIELV